MTSVATPPRNLRSAAPGGAQVTGRLPTRRRSRRWLRAVVPFAVVIALLAGSATAYQLQQADQSDPAYLSPTRTEGIGGARLASLLAARGVTVEPMTKSSDALVAAYRGNATLFVPTPSLVHPFYLRMLKLLPSTTTVVLVAPDSAALANGRLPVGVSDTRLATAATSPGCPLPAATGAGVAAAARIRYTRVSGLYSGERYRCYRSGLVGLRWYSTELVVVGANDPFRNDRINEYGNAALAAGLLGGQRRLIWLDLHRLEPRPGLITDPQATAGAGAPPSLGPGPPDPDFPIAGSDRPDPDSTNRQRGERGKASGDGGTNPLWGAFPQAAWATLVLLMVAAVLLALARGRRLGAPIGEPLPVTVPAAETVRGRGRLYQRARARAQTLATLREAARERLARQLNLPAGTPDTELAAAVAARTGLSADDVYPVLTQPIESDDDELVHLATYLDALVTLVGDDRSAPPQVPNEGEFR